MHLRLDGFPAISGNALEVSQGDLRGWPRVHPDWSVEAQVAPPPRPPTGECHGAHAGFAKATPSLSAALRPCTTTRV